jgi:hypothetical protein
MVLNAKELKVHARVRVTASVESHDVVELLA